MITLKRVYDEPDALDGYRVLVGQALATRH